MNLFTGMDRDQIISFALMFGLFNFFVVLEAAALTFFYVASRPRRGRVRTAAIWHVVGGFWFMWSMVSTVWAAPAQKAFTDDQGLHLGTGARFTKVIIGLVFAAVGVGCMVIGFVKTAQQKRLMAQEAVYSDSAAS